MPGYFSNTTSLGFHRALPKYIKEKGDESRPRELELDHLPADTECKYSPLWPDGDAINYVDDGSLPTPCPRLTKVDHEEDGLSSLSSHLLSSPSKSHTQRTRKIHLSQYF
jgi:hypothetical protein